jgi:EAL domain-containing protein (putative c-di-GMP-specific phosphodiesterase class I)
MLDENLELYHLQGDEYVILTKESNRDDFINKIDTYVHKISKKPIELEGKQIFLNITAAVSFENKEKLLATADMALKVAKRNNQSFIVFSEDISLNKEYENNLKWSKKVKKAIDEDNIVPVYQPIVNNENGKWEKYESLVRLKEDDKLISPYFFLEISKKSRQYNNITKIMIEKSFERFKDESAEFSVNLTVDDILNHEISGYIVEMLERYKIGSRVVFELVESESIDNFEEVSSFIDKVKSYGVKLAIDDFGTGYSNFEYLLKLKADYIKIDGSMIKDIDQNEEARLVVSTIVDFAKKIGMKTIAEFVENESILDTIKELGIDYSQGYHFSAPKENF